MESSPANSPSIPRPANRLPGDFVPWPVFPILTVVLVLWLPEWGTSSWLREAGLTGKQSRLLNRWSLYTFLALSMGLTWWMTRGVLRIPPSSLRGGAVFFVGIWVSLAVHSLCRQWAFPAKSAAWFPPLMTGIALVFYLPTLLIATLHSRRAGIALAVYPVVLFACWPLCLKLILASLGWP